MSLLENLRRCVRRHNVGERRITRVLFNVNISESFKSVDIPSQIKCLLVYLARDGVTVTDLFRRPGNSQDLKKLISLLEAGRFINWTEYNFYTLANLAKRYLLHIRGGIFGPECEKKMLNALDLLDNQSRTEAMHEVIVSQSRPVQHLLALLFGIWFRMIYHTEVNTMSVEAVAKSVAGSIFPNSATTVENVERASKVMEYLITGFASAELFSRELIEYFTRETKTSIFRIERFQYKFFFPSDVAREESVRLFIRMLLDEGKKYGFHIVNDAVSKEVFDQATVDTPLVSSAHRLHPQPPSSSAAASLSSNSMHLLLVNNSGSDQHHLIDHNSSPMLMHTSSSLMTHPTSSVALSRHRSAASSIKLAKGGLFRPSTLALAEADRVQQFSEKRTCVTATPLKVRAVGGGDAPSSRQPIPSGSKPLARPASPPPVVSTADTPYGFNSVKRRQLERLQKRSDWFLSPPTGVRSGGLMLIDPQCAKETPLSAIAVQQPVPFSSPSTLPPSTLGDRLTSTPLNASVRSPVYGSNAYVGDLAGADPQRLWTDGAALASTPSMDEKENCIPGEYEVRYYIVERNYCAEPPAALRNTAFPSSPSFTTPGTNGRQAY